MKEISIQEKAQLYDKAIERAKKWRNAPNIDKMPTYGNRIIEEIFPELKENEDEKIKNAILNNLKKMWGNCQDDICGIHVEYAIAWLEKQDKKSSWKPSKEEMDVLYSLSYITNEYDEHKEDVITHLYQDLKREFFNDSSYENMFSLDNKEDDVRRRSTIQVLEYARSLDAYNQYGKADIDKNISWLEKQGETSPILSNSSNIGKNEQKSDDKVEPKFKVGNWYQCTKSFYGKGVIFTKNTAYYCAQKGCLQDEYGCHIAIVKDLYDNFKLWTIQDAKDGDVLEFEDCRRLVVGIVSYINKSTGKVCWLENNRFKSRNYYDLDTINPHPASREKRDALMKAMADAGYEWDSEKKELKYKLTAFEDAIKDMMDDYRDAIDEDGATAEEVKKRSEYLLSLIPYKQTDWCENEI